VRGEKGGGEGKEKEKRPPLRTSHIVLRVTNSRRVLRKEKEKKGEKRKKKGGRGKRHMWGNPDHSMFIAISEREERGGRKKERRQALPFPSGLSPTSYGLLKKGKGGKEKGGKQTPI